MTQKLWILFFCSACLISSVLPVSASEMTASEMIPSNSFSAGITLDEQEITVQAIHINGIVYYQLRDLGKKTGFFSVSYNSETDMVYITTESHSSLPEELQLLHSAPEFSRQTFVLNSENNAIQLTAYNIDGYNYVRLEELFSHVQTFTVPTPSEIISINPGLLTYTVVSGDTLSAISTRFYGSTEGVQKIWEANGLSSDNIRIGQILIIP